MKSRRLGPNSSSIARGTKPPENRMQPKRQRGAGGIEQLPNGSFRARFRNEEGRKVTLGVFGTRREAEATLDAALYQLNQQHVAPNTGLTLLVYGARYLDERERQGVRGITTERSRWRRHIATTELAKLALATITTLDLKRWRDQLQGKEAVHKHRGELGRKLARSTIKRAQRFSGAALLRRSRTAS